MTDKPKSALVNFSVTAPVQVSFAHLVSTTRFKNKDVEVGNPFYDASFLFPKDSPDLATLKSLVIAEANKIFSGKQLRARRLTQEEADDGGFVEVNVPWKDGDKEADKAKANGKDQEIYRGMVVVKARTTKPPALSGVENGKIVEYNDPAMRASLTRLFYSGAYLAPRFTLHSYPARDNKPGGVGLWPDAVCFVKHGPKIGGQSANAAEVFKSFAGTVTTEDPGSNEGDEF